MAQSFIDTTLFISGASEQPVYEKISANDEYLIRTDNGSYRFFRKDFLHILKQLRGINTIQINKLTTQQTQLLNSTIEVIRLLQNTKALSDLVLKDIQHVFGDIKNPKPGTVAAFFIGCFNTDSKIYKGPIGCNPRCAASLLKCGSTHLECNDAVLIYSNHQFNRLNDKQSEHAYIYVDNPKFTALSAREKKVLKDSGVSRITMILGGPDGSYREVIENYELGEFSERGERRSAITEQQTATDNSGMTVAIIIFVSIIILIILLFLIYYYELPAKYNFNL